MKNDWNPLEIKVIDLERKISDRKIQVPTYQRGVVWDEKKQRELIESIKLGYPFGSLIIFRYDDPIKPELLIDGLQRSTSLFNFIHNPSKFFDENDIDDDILLELIDKIGLNGSINGQKEQIKKIIIDWVHSFKDSSEVRNMNEYQCATLIMNEFPVLRGENDLSTLETISQIIKPIFTKYKNICQTIEDKKIPYIEITGDDSSLSEIFFRINDRGIKLNKENKFAATWANSPVKITNEKLNPLVNLVRDRYDQILTDGTSIYGYDSQEFLQKKELDVFELTYAFGKYITKQFPELFPYKDNLIAVDSIGFVLINACLMGTKSSLPKMNELLLSTFNYNDIQINEFLIKIISCINYVDELLGPVTKFKGNKRLNNSPLHTDFQIVSLVASVFRLKHIQFENDKYYFNLSSTNSNWNNYDKLIRKNVLKKYISDIVSDYWSGHGDNTLDNIIHDNPEIYTKEIDKSEFKSILYNWFNRVKSDRNELTAKDVKNAGNQEKVLLNLIYSNSFTAASQLNIEKFDIEHLATKNLLENKLKKYNGTLKLPISSFGNLCLLPEYTNRKKKDAIIYDDDKYIDKIGNKLTIKEIEDKFTFTKKDDLIWLKRDNLTSEEFKAYYFDFINNRFEIILNKIIDILYNN